MLQLATVINLYCNTSSIIKCLVYKAACVYLPLVLKDIAVTKFIQAKFNLL